MNIVALIPAREGSKGLKNKNIKDLCGQPVISYSILDGLRTPSIDEVYVSTDSTEIANEAIKYGAEVPFLRPKELAQDNSLMIDVVRNFLFWYNTNKDIPIDLLVLLLPTTPIRDILTLEHAIEKIKKHPEATGLRSVHEFVESPYKWFTKDGDYLKPLLTNDYNDLDKSRQDMPKVFVPNGYIEIIKPKSIFETNSLYGNKILNYTTNFTPEIDSEEGFILAHTIMSKEQ